MVVLLRLKKWRRKMAKICLEDTENNELKIDVEGTGKELIDLFSNAFLKKEYLRVVAARGLSDCIMHEFMKGNKNEETN